MLQVVIRDKKEGPAMDAGPSFFVIYFIMHNLERPGEKSDNGNGSYNDENRADHVSFLL